MNQINFWWLLLLMPVSMLASIWVLVHLDYVMGVFMKIKLSGVIAAASWVSVLVMAWLLFAGTVEWSSQRVGIFVILLLIALGSGVIYTSDGQKRNHE